ncbi:MAG: sugar transferase [Acidobacteria bacterium]|nr:sugar transferase [Acidobacteriota bacterium]
MYSRHHRKERILFALSDAVLTALAFEAAYRTRLELPLERVFYILDPIKTVLLGFVALAWVLIGRGLGVYERLESAGRRMILRDAFRQCVLGGAALVMFEYALRLDLSRPFLSLVVAYDFVLLCLFRLNAGRLARRIRREFGAPHYVLIVGLGEAARRLAGTVEQSHEYGVRLVGFLAESDSGAETRPETVELEGSYPVYALGELGRLLRQHVIDEILFAVDSRQLAELEEVFLFCDEEGVRTRVLADFFPHVNSKVSLDRLGSAPLLTFSAAPHDEMRLLVKRATDVVLAGAALILLAPAMALIALAIRLTSPGAVVFRQVRCGLSGRRFVFYKFRSMCHNAEELKAGVAHLNTRDGVVFKIPNDPRLTSIGKFLRKFSIDEWPQLWNVVKGDMSLVGPRPAIPEEVEQYKRWQRRRLRMRPGLTCLWAVSGRDALDFETWMKLDMQYIDAWSLALDWKIMLRTIPRVLSGRGAH